MTTVLITGIAGFIGSNTAEQLLKKDYNVVGIDNFSTGNKNNIKHFIKKVNFKRGDVTNLRFLKRIMKNVDYVLHYAALPSVPYSVNHPKETHDVNVKGTFNVLLAARDSGVRKVIFASSSAVYGNTNKLPIKEGQELNPFSPYAAHKIIGEQYCKLFYNVYGLRTTSLRYFNVYGPRQNPNSEYAAVIPKFLSLMKKGKKPIIYGDGKQTRDFIFVDDVIKLNLLAMKSKKSDGKVYNVASGKRTSVLELVEIMNEVLGTDLKPIHEKSRPGDVKHSYANVSKAKSDLKFKSQINLQQGIKIVL
ncbi:MAG: SDR family oxidoreductase [Nanoarchaeota archaeon]|nr:SDR family oxidoreductase [DPANN group archaeon]MBL7116645.1 SDR family oxidoreductase [Nanoarchaeota archaeon]